MAIGEGSFTAGIKKALTLHTQLHALYLKHINTLKELANAFCYAIDSVERHRSDSDKEAYTVFLGRAHSIADTMIVHYNQIGDDENQTILKGLFNDSKYYKYFVSKLRNVS